MCKTNKNMKHTNKTKQTKTNTNKKTNKPKSNIEKLQKNKKNASGALTIKTRLTDWLSMWNNVAWKQAKDSKWDSARSNIVIWMRKHKNQSNHLIQNKNKNQ